jgi:hypothetical protein
MDSNSVFETIRDLILDITGDEEIPRRAAWWTT